ncbi:MAG: ribosome biogenesis GTPase Der [Pseudomonadota bacterium]|nr:ribosome biogenesis GTPase Der [Pseudomonadota bacterium]
MLPVIALIGRPNVGKSTLFNRLTKSRDALVADYPGLTRDRQYGYGKLGSMPYLIVDTGGISGDEEGIQELMAQQTIQAIKESNALIVMVDGRTGPTAADEYIIDLTRKHSKKVWFVVNKAEGLDEDIAVSEFHDFGLPEPIAISASHGDRVSALMDEILKPYESEFDIETIDNEDQSEKNALSIAIIGRPNAGKSTLINRLIGEERLVVFDQPGTTRDSVSVPLERDGMKYVLFDTAGVRRKGKVKESIEKFSIIKTLQSIEKSNVVFAVMDAKEGITEQDISLMGLVVERGRALVLLINKWDGLDLGQKTKVDKQIKRRLPFLDFAERHMISALHGTGVGDLMPASQRAYKAATRKLSTNALTNELEAALIEHAPPLIKGRRIRLRYAHQGGRNPPTIVIHGNQTERLPLTYKRYLINRFRKKFRLKGTPIKLIFKTSDNPYKGKRNKLTPRQTRKKKRLMRFVKKK